MRASSRTNPIVINDEQRRRDAVELRLQGATFDEIADRCGYENKSNAYRAVHTAVTRIGREEARDMFDLDIARLDKLMRAAWPKAMDGDDKAIANVIKILERRARMCGYDNLTHALPVAAHSDHDNGPSTGKLADVLGVDAGELEENMARVLHEYLPTIDHDTDDEDGA